MRGRDLELLRGAVDMHAHTAPSLFPRPITDHDLGRYALDYGMRGFVLKDHDGATFHRAAGLKRSMPGIDPIGAIVLNRSVGGINPYVVEAALQYGAKVVWMPTNHSKHHDDHFGIGDYPQFGRRTPQLPGPGVTVLDGNGRLTDDAATVIKLVAEAGACLCTGHLSLQETRLVLAEANRVGLERLLVTHVNWSLTKYELDIQRELVAAGAYLEIVSSSCVSPLFGEQTPAELAPVIDAHAGERLILSSDLGQSSGPPHPEGMRMLLRSLLDEGVDYSALEKMTKENPAFLTGLGGC